MTSDTCHDKHRSDSLAFSRSTDEAKVLLLTLGLYSVYAMYNACHALHQWHFVEASLGFPSWQSTEATVKTCVGRTRGMSSTGDIRQCRAGQNKAATA